ncbi:spermidine/putrescine transport system ATP-binding protein [Acholeplasma morum]|uniref:spermidine/putrescine ABC transporter ATP-binding protein n=1 Tax=Paracholeplasma morum TaxID=264637 RepID=UPI00195AA722|nr:spermidine/putrescine ABC transporter ATP-binding protein [Paracholeplasma morum]MBM7453886.1 spermidine/putrescine transport system ATP-binding protein [Paracholeplasma morum]
MKKVIELKNVTKAFSSQVVLKGIDLDIYENEFVTLLGPSGCGKTTTLRIIGGFEKPSKGEVLFNGVSVVDLPPHKRPTNTVFQRYALFPHLDVYENVAFGLRLKLKKSKLSSKEKEAEIERKVSKYLQMVGLVGYEKRSINKLSGGQQQRVAIARALINEPEVLLLDEPLAALDLKLRQEMQYELKEIQRNAGITFIFVTHDQEEALTMSDKIVVMNDGEIQQIGTPEDIYNEPINRFVAGFIGESNIIEGIMKDDYLVHFDGKDYVCVDKGFKRNEEVDIVLRPEDLDIVAQGEGFIDGVVDSIIFKGVHYEIDVKTKDRLYTIHTIKYHEEGSDVSIIFDKEDIHVMEKW